ncbi:DUF6615 family protein [Streptomyces sp. NPDC002838]|uniref:DUF6615 family protein n=1 Tax=Streptomyces sp. NPDC002838 TaxID=3154436 RepID=UPI0033228CEB
MIGRALISASAAKTVQQPSLCDVLLWMAGDTFHWLHNGHHYYPPAPGEESLTDMHIRHLRQFLGDRVKIFQFNKDQERQNGADWELWIHDRSHGVGLRIQAKKASKQGRYPFAHVVKGTNADQCALLLQDALKVRCVPVYLLYNHWEWDGADLEAEAEAEQAGLLCGHGVDDPARHGATLLSAYRVASEIQRKRDGHNLRHRALWRESLPWNRVLCGGRAVSGTSHQVLTGVADAVRGLIRPGMPASTPNREEAEAGGGILRDGPNLLPLHVVRLLEAHEAEPPPPPVPTATTVLVDVSDDNEQTHTWEFVSCVRPSNPARR